MSGQKAPTLMFLLLVLPIPLTRGVLYCVLGVGRFTVGFVGSLVVIVIRCGFALCLLRIWVLIGLGTVGHFTRPESDVRFFFVCQMVLLS